MRRLNHHHLLQTVCRKIRRENPIRDNTAQCDMLLFLPLFFPNAGKMGILQNTFSCYAIFIIAKEVIMGENGKDKNAAKIYCECLR
jgi:hypothetical protein